jgi:hypothetical protein
MQQTVGKAAIYLPTGFKKYKLKNKIKGNVKNYTFKNFEWYSFCPI